MNREGSNRDRASPGGRSRNGDDRSVADVPDRVAVGGDAPFRAAVSDDPAGRAAVGDDAPGRAAVSDDPAGPSSGAHSTARSAFARIDRRRLLAGAVGVAGLAGCLSIDGDDEERDDEDGDDTEGDDETGADEEPPFTVRTVDAPGSEAGELTMPESGTVTLLNFTRTACPTSEGQLSTLREAKSSVSDERVRFCSIVRAGRDPTETDDGFADWWDDHDGEWSLAIDEDGDVFDYWEGNTTPTTIVLAEEATPTWRTRGGVSAGDVSRAVNEAVAELSSDE